MSRQRVDLNLLNIFHAVMLERSVTRAANRLCMTQPAVSNALQRLRAMFQDELFTKVRDGVEPTERALMLWPQLDEALETIRSVIQPEKFQSATTQVTFNVAVTDTLVDGIVPPLAMRFLEEAPMAKIHFHMHSDPGSRIEVERGTLDFAVGMFPSMSNELRYEPLLADDYICVMRRDHQRAAAPLDLDGFLAENHVLVRQTPSWTGIVDSWLSLIGQRRRNVLVVNSARQAITMVLESDLFAAVPAQFVAADTRRDRLATAALPFATEKIVYKLASHERSAHDPAATWLRKLIRDVVAQI